MRFRSLRWLAAGSLLTALTVASAVADAAPRSGWAATIDRRLAELERTPRPTSPARDAPELQARLTDIVAAATAGATLGVTVRDLDTGEVLFDWDGDLPLNPASNQKLLTATAAVALLGPDFAFATTVQRAGDALVLGGGGDPSLQVEDLEAMVAALPADALVGARRIVVDDAAFSARRFGPGYDPDGPGWSYMAPSGALSLQFNTVEIAVRPGSPGEPVRVSVQPPCDHLVIRNAATTGRGEGLRISTRADGEQTAVVVGGRLRAGSDPVRMRRRITDPGLFTGSVFARALASRGGGAVLPVARGTTPAGARLVLEHVSAPLREVLGSALKFSNNFTTEQILRTLGHLDTTAPGDWDNGAALVHRFWRALGLPADGLVFVNASGLGHGGRVTPRALVELLQVMADDRLGAADVAAAMPIAGREGTLTGRLRRTGGRVRAKTGTLAGASALTGVVSDRTGTPRLGFSILVNGPVGSGRARRIQDRLVVALVDHVGE